MAEPPQEQGRDEGCHQRRERGVSRGEGGSQPDQAEHQGRRPEQADQHADIGGNTFAAVEFEPDREEVAEEGAECGQHRRIGAAVIAGDDDGDRALERVADQGCRRKALAAGAQHVGGADIAASDRAQILRAGEFGQHQAERDRAEEIAEQEGDDEECVRHCGSSHRALFRTNQTCS